MTDNLTIFGVDYTGVTGIKAKGTGNGTLTYIRPTGTKSITENGTGIDVAAYSTVDVDVSIDAESGTMVIRDTQDSHGGTVREITAGSVVTGTKAITSNGTYDVAAYADASVNVPSPEPELQSKTATPTESQQTVTPDSGYDGLSSVTVGAISSTYVGSGVARRTSSNLTASGATVTVPSGYYESQATKSVSSGTAGTPTAAKGTVSNHSVSVTPSVTNTTGYITGGTKTGTAVTVAASELVSGTLSITSSGTKDVTNYASASVAAGSATASAAKGSVSNHSVSVTPSVTRTAGYITAGTANGTAVTVSASELVSGTLSVTENDTYDVTNYANVEVDVSGSTTYTATISGTGSSWTCFARVNGTGDSYYANGSTFTFTDTDEIVFSCAGSRAGGTITLNGTVVAQHAYNSVSFTLASPRTDMTISMAYDTESTIAITVPELSITENGKYSVAQYAYVDVETQSYQNDFKSLIDRTVTSLTFPSNLTTIGESAFRGCTNLALTSLPSTLTSIGSNAFYDCTNLALTSLPSGVTSIGGNAFYNCHSLALTSLPSGLTSILSYTFYGCTNLSLTSLPSGVTSIGNYAFNECINLILTSLPSTLTSISSYAFARCESIISIQSDAVITTLGNCAFIGNSSHPSNLKTARFPNMAQTSNFVTVFGSTTASSACQLLEACDIGSTTGIATNAFANCYKLQTLVLRKTASVCTLANVSAFTNTPMSGYNGLTGTVYVPSALISSYQTATNWTTLYNNGTVTFSAIEGSQWAL